MGKNRLNYDLLITLGFSCERKWDNKYNQFRLIYITQGYDCDILIAPFPQVAVSNNKWMAPTDQVNDLSDIDVLKHHHINGWQVYINNLNNHLATFEYECQLIDFFNLTGVEYKNIKSNG